jgi:2-hydroxy-6-oxonona-2,4-dienedioate hydrolase
MERGVGVNSIWTSMSEIEFQVHWVEAAGWRTRVLETGSGPTLMLMHGTGGHLEAFSRNLRALAAHFHVIAYDFPGQGFTSCTERDLEIADYVEHLSRLMDEMRVTRAHLCGESLGGWAAICFAAAFPDRVDRLVLNTPGGTMTTPEVMERIRSLSQEAADDPTPERIRARLEWLMADPKSVTDELVDVRRSIYSRPGFAKSMSHVLCLQDPQVRARNLVTDDILASIKAPTLVVWTSDDPSGPAGEGMSVAERIPLGKFAFIDGAGHWPQWEQREAYDDLMVAFLTEADD